MISKLTPSAAAAGFILSFASTAVAQDSDQDGVADAFDVFPCDATATGVAYAPGQGVSGTLLFEDQWPDFADLDFNDVVVAYHYEYRLHGTGVSSVRAVFDVLALGGTIHSGLGLRLPVAAGAAASATLDVNGTVTSLSPSGADAELTFVIAPDLRAYFGGAEGSINSDTNGASANTARLIVDITFTSPVVLDTAAAPHDVYTFRSNAVGHEIHRPMYGGTASMDGALFNVGMDASTPTRRFVDYDGLPYAIALPEPVAYPHEAIAIEQLYPRVMNFAASGGATDADFYLTVGDGTARYNGAAAPALPARTIDTACVPVEPPSCLAILQSGQSNGDGVYTVDVDGTGPLAPSEVYCNMTIDGGGWMLTHYKPNGVASAEYDLLVGNVMMRGHPLRTRTTDPIARPVVPDGHRSTYDQVLFVGGNATWQGQMGAWVRWSIGEGASTPTALSGVRTANGRTQMWLSNTGWGGTTTNANFDFVLWDTAGISPICGGANVGRGRHCPAAVHGLRATYPYHFDTTGHRELYVR